MTIDTDESIHSIHRNLQHYHECTVSELGKSFYKNYSEFVLMAQEGERFESDLTAMRGMISQLKGFSTEISGIREKIANPTTSSNTNTQEDNQHNNYTSASPSLSLKTGSPELTAQDPELQAKLKRIIDFFPEVAKFVEKATSVLIESSSMAVYLEKQWKPAQVWLLSTGCLIASRKAKVSITQGVRHKLTFERFYPAEGILLSNVKDTSDLKNCLKLKNEQGSVFLHTEDEAAKSIWFSNLQKVIQEAQNLENDRALKKQPNSQTKIQTPLLQQQQPAHKRTSSVCTAASQTTGSQRPSLESFFEYQELSPEIAGNLEKTLEDLSEAIICTSYDQSIDLVEKSNTTLSRIFYVLYLFVVKYDLIKITFNSPIVNALKTRFSHLIEKLSKFLFMEISDNLICKEKLVLHIEKLKILGFTEEVGEKFLLNRSEMIKQKLRKVQYDGDLFGTTSLLSLITFESIENSFDWYKICFKEEAKRENFIYWVKNEISRYSEIFSRQTFRSDLEMREIVSCIEDAIQKCIIILAPEGLDLSLFLIESLGESLETSLQSNRSALQLMLFEETLRSDDFEMTIATDRPDWRPDGIKLPKGIKLTETAVQTFIAVDSFILQISPLLNCDSMKKFGLNSIVKFIVTASDQLLHHFHTKLDVYNFTQLVNLASDFEAISLLLIPFLYQTLKFKKLQKLQVKLSITSEAIFSIISERIGKSLIPSEFSIYSQNQNQKNMNMNKINGEKTDENLISSWTENTIPILAKLTRDSSHSSTLSASANLVSNVVQFILSSFKTALTENLIKFSAHGLHQFILDLSFLFHLMGNVISPDLIEFKDELIQSVLSNSGQFDTPLPSTEQTNAEIIKLEQKFAKFSLDFNSF